MSAVLVTGANGYIGRHTLPALLRKGFEVLACCYGAVGERQPGVTYIELDLRDEDAVAALMDERRPDCLLHLAWDVTPGQYLVSDTNLIWLQTTLRLVRCFLRAGGRRVVTMGTCAEYCESSNLLRETDPLATEPLYAAAKTSVRYLVSAMSREAEAAYAHVRLFYPYGLDEDPRRVIPSVLSRLMAGETVDVSAGTQVRDYLFIEDVGEALAAIAASTLDGPVNLGSGQGVALRTVFETMEELLDAKGRVRYGALPITGMQASSIVADIGRLTRLGWKPAVGLREGLERTYRFILERGERS